MITRFDEAEQIHVVSQYKGQSLQHRSHAVFCLLIILYPQHETISITFDAQGVFLDALVNHTISQFNETHTLTRTERDDYGTPITIWTRNPSVIPARETVQE